MAPEEWGWEAYFYSGYDQQYAAEHGYCCWPDHDGMQGGMDYIPWLLSEWKKAGHPVDVLSVHFYPQGGEDSDDVSTRTCSCCATARRAQLWDPNYKSESWINDKVYLIPRLKGWITDQYYAGTPVAITEYNWGAENHINGATTQADIYGIFGREGLDMATRWTTPDCDARRPTRRCRCIATTTAPIRLRRHQHLRERSQSGQSFRLRRVAPSDGTMTVMVISKVAERRHAGDAYAGHFSAIRHRQGLPADIQQCDPAFVRHRLVEAVR